MLESPRWLQKVYKISQREVEEIVQNNSIVSVVSSPELAEFFSLILNKKINFNKSTLELIENFKMIVGNIKGRLQKDEDGNWTFTDRKNKPKKFSQKELDKVEIKWQYISAKRTK